MRFYAGLLQAAVLLALAGTAPAMPDDLAYRASVEKWRQQYQASLKADYGWLSVSDLFWLHEGANKFGSDPLNDIVLPSAPPDAGTFEFHAGHTVAHIKPGVSP